MISLEEIHSDLLPIFERKFGEVHCRSEFDKRLFFRFKSEESAICGHVITNAYLEKHDIPGRVIASTTPRVIILILGSG